MDNSAGLRATNARIDQIQSPTSPLGNFPELAAMYQSSFQLPVSNAATAGMGYNTDVEVANQKAAQEAEQKKLAYLADPSNYKKVQRADGGYGFYSPDGREISAADYASVTGKSVADVLADSQNPIDIAYKTDYDNLQKLLTAVTTGDTATTEEYYTKDEKLRKMKPDELIKAFREAYPTVYGPWNKKAGVPLGQTAIPTVSSSGSDLASMLSQYGINVGQ